jgi:dolichyl-phosphate beta-glucosyltransferase
MNETAIIIPCFNEENRLSTEKILQLIEQTKVFVFFANDGSKDNTLELLKKIQKKNKEKINILNFDINSGKANVIFNSIEILKKTYKFDYIGYFDADFSTPVSELVRMLKDIEENKLNFIFGSRIKILNSEIKRKIFRHYIGRIVATIINFKYKLSIYDTQCGAKIFSKNILDEAFSNPFYTSWLFDVEVFVRLKKKNLLNTGKEFPLIKWVDVDGSKLKWIDMFKILKELYLIYKKY